jgi:hypothetical protein
MKNTLLDELRRIESIKGQTGKGKRGLTAPTSRRKVLAEALGVAPVGKWVHFRLTSLGAYCLGLSTDYKPTPLAVKPILRVLANLELVVTGKLTTADTLMLDTFAVKQSNAVWQLEQSKILEAIASGRNLKDWQAFLAARSHDPLPQPVQQFLRDLENRASSLQDLGAARLIRCAACPRRPDRQRLPHQALLFPGRPPRQHHQRTSPVSRRT